MSFPLYIPLGPARLHPHAFFDGLAYLVGFQLYLRARRRRGDVIDSYTRWSVVAAAVLGAALGSRVLFWLEDPTVTAAHWRELTFLLGGKTVIGGIVGGVISVELTKRVLGITQRTGDLFAVPTAVGIAIGRIGCFLTGLDDQTFGTPSALPWAVDFGDGVRRHPVQLYESLFVLSLAWLLTRLDRRPHANGDLFRWLMIGYMGWRVAIDAFKPEVRLVAGLSTLQLAALAACVYYAQEMARRQFRTAT